MPKLIITRGLPASGKTTLAKDYERAHVKTTVRVNLDDLREMLHAGVFVDGKDGTEKVVKRLRNRLVSVALLDGKDVICDDTNLKEKDVQELHLLAFTHGAEFAIWDLCHVPLEECIQRDRVRAGKPDERAVGEAVIRGMAQRAKLPPLGGPAPAWTPLTTRERLERYVPNPALPHAIIVDIDSTVALHDARSPYDYSRVSTDTPNVPVIDVVRALWAVGTRVICLSGRPDSCREDTERWLQTHMPIVHELHMRAHGDTRNDALVKLDIFTESIASRFHVVAAFDDRDRVVRVWRQLGLLVFQVNDGDF
jgi:predicted kinase